MRLSRLPETGEMIMKTFYMVRHGETILNILNRAQGWADSPLTREGVHQAALLGRTIKETPIIFDAAFTSDSGRARETARLVLEYSGQNTFPLTETKDLRETAFGSFEGCNSDEMWKQGGLAVGVTGMSHRSSSDLKIRALEGIKSKDKIGCAESFADVRQRITGFLDRVLLKSDASSILLVSHSMLICCMLRSLFSNELKMERVPNASVTKIRYTDGKFVLDYIGQTESL